MLDGKIVSVAMNHFGFSLNPTHSLSVQKNEMHHTLLKGVFLFCCTLDEWVRSAIFLTICLIVSTNGITLPLTN